MAPLTTKPPPPPPLPPSPPPPPPIIQTAADLHLARHLSQTRLKQTWERIFTRFSHDFSGVADEIDPLTGALIVDNGHLRGLADADLTITDSCTPDSPAVKNKQECSNCADRDELDDSPCRHHHRNRQLTPTRTQLRSWRPSHLHAHLSAAALPTFDSADLSFQLQKHDIDGRALAALTLADMREKMGLREPAVARAVWAEIRRLQRILAVDRSKGEDGDGDGERDVWAPPPRAQDPFYSSAWRDEHPDGTPSAFVMKKRKEGGREKAEEEEEEEEGRKKKKKKGVKIVRVGTELAPVPIGTRTTFEVAIPIRRSTPPAAAPAAAKEEEVKTPTLKKKKKKKETPGVKEKTPAAAAAAAKEMKIQSPVPKPSSSRKVPAVGSTPAPAAKTPASKRTPTPTSTPPHKRAPKPPPTTTRKKPTRTPTQTPRTPGWTTSIDRRRLKGHSITRLAGYGGGEDEDELASPAPGMKGGGGEEGKVAVVVEEVDIGKEEPQLQSQTTSNSPPPPETTTSPTTPPQPSEPHAAQKPKKPKANHTCARKGFCFACMDLEGSEDDLI